MYTRRGFVRSMFGAAAITLPVFRDDGLHRIAALGGATAGRTPEDVAQDESFWFQVQQAFTVDRTLVNLNNGGVCPSPKVVQDALRRYLEFSNQAPVHTMWRVLEPQVEGVRQRLAGEFGCDTEEMAITRNASEALENVQLGIELGPGDEVLTTDQDYGRMLTTWDQRRRRDGIVVKSVSFPVPPPSMQFLVDVFADAITPRTRVIHFCHITNLSGQIFPVRDICRLARDRGIPTIVDGAHAFAHFPFTRDDLECDYYGTSLHKWLLAPHGTGFLYAKRENIAKVWPLMAAPDSMNDDVRKFEEIGTHPAANHNAIAEALTFHQGIGVERKAARLRYLRDRWMRRLEGQRGIQLHTSFDPAMACGLANVGIEGVDPGALTAFLWGRFKIIVTPINHPACTGIRVTPNVYTTLEEVDRFGDAMEGVIQHGLPA
ncbi:MAG: aminotransferase class V-fold PLP-dependent enzyme [Gemmatimonadota bacterium]|nr:aminotransferase class V-fold PLP-dependent enzyme [Gemmatimonadota bacterium]MDH3367321.1 aminotransferase class V-fold PLP-dependent enzyme [Gemmatimonadota bacterium]MDH3476762.1 aminotransferase class V-fold PLP-dependent enzyme [Gemmatimonadota bacterium]MDH3568646.1 aminotransferase class V-fold PLP-dependent enzyme [Gemmatimonadota bacterium]MDH5551261.1 aminotransferase class V-fold PLP-dependent enzyme [Gemmatimonadota bacterium]